MLVPLYSIHKETGPETRDLHVPHGISIAKLGLTSVVHDCAIPRVAEFWDWSRCPRRLSLSLIQAAFVWWASCLKISQGGSAPQIIMTQPQRHPVPLFLLRLLLGCCIVAGK